MAKPAPTFIDYVVSALSPVLIMALVGSLCFFLIDVRYRGEMQGVLCWVMFWFVLASVLISRIAIEQTSERAALFGIALGTAVWLYLLQNSPAYILSIVLMAIVWYCANKLVWDCTLIDDDLDSSGQGLLQSTKSESPPAKPKAVPSKTPGKRPTLVKKPVRKPSSSPGRTVLYFSFAALPLFGLGQVLLPASATSGRRIGFILMVIYLAAALGLLVTTSFLGLRRYLRQRFLRMPAAIAFAWVKFGAGVAVFILIGAMFVPRPGAGAAWTTLRAQVDYRLRQTSQYASGRQPSRSAQVDQPGESGNQNASDNQEQSGNANSPDRNGQSSGQPLTDQANAVAPPQPPPLTGSGAVVYNLLRKSLLVVAAIIVGWWIFRCRHLLMEIFRSIREAIRTFLLLNMPKPVRSKGPEPIFPPRRPLAEFRNPFFTDQEHSRPPEEIILYTYEALQAWAHEKGVESHPEQTAREFCQQMAEQLPELSGALHQLSFLHAHAAYGQHLPAQCDMEPLKELWRELTWH